MCLENSVSCISLRTRIVDTVILSTCRILPMTVEFFLAETCLSCTSESTRAIWTPREGLASVLRSGCGYLGTGLGALVVYPNSGRAQDPLLLEWPGWLRGQDSASMWVCRRASKWTLVGLSKHTVSANASPRKGATSFLRAVLARGWCRRRWVTYLYKNVRMLEMLCT